MTTLLKRTCAFLAYSLFLVWNTEAAAPASLQGKTILFTGSLGPIGSAYRVTFSGSTFSADGGVQGEYVYAPAGDSAGLVMTFPGFPGDSDNWALSFITNSEGTFAGQSLFDSIPHNVSGGFTIEGEIGGGPVNDLFANRQLLTGANTTAQGTNVEATKQAGEPNHNGEAGGTSVWWTWVAPANGAVTITTAGSSFDTVLAVYTGSSVNSLAEITSDDDGAGVGGASQVDFIASAGTAYQIAVDGYGGESGTIVLNLTSVPLNSPENDNFADRLQLSGPLTSATGSNLNATRETGERNHAAEVGGTSVWWTWTAPETGVVTISTLGSSFDTLLAVYTGDNLSSLVEVASADEGGQNGTSEVAVAVTGGTTYHIVVDGYEGATGSILLTIRAGATFPENDSFASRILLSGWDTVANGSNMNATKEVSEPNHADSPGGKSVWWTWVAPGNGPVEITTAGSSFDTLLAVYTGNSLGNLTVVDSNDDGDDGGTSRVEFIAQAGTSYHIGVDGFSGRSGTISLALRALPLPVNDNLANRVALVGISGSILGTNRWATTEPGELVGAGAAGKTLWWAWTAPDRGTLFIADRGSDFQPLVSLFTVDSTLALQPVPAQPAAPGEFRWTVAAGTTYLLSVDSRASNPGGRVNLSWDFRLAPPNDLFSSAPLVSGDQVLKGTNSWAMQEPGEPPLAAGVTGGRTIWWKFRAAQRGTARISLEGSNFQPVVAVFTGSSVAALTPVIARVGTSDVANPELFGEIRFLADAGVDYYIAADSAAQSGGEITLNFMFAPGRLPLNARAVPRAAGTIALNPSPDAGGLFAEGASVELIAQPFPGFVLDRWVGATSTSAGARASVAIGNEVIAFFKPANDDWTSAVPLPVTAEGVAGSNLGATDQQGEAGNGAGRSVWFRAVADKDGWLIAQTSESTFDPVVRVHAGSTFTGGQALAANDDGEEIGRESRVRWAVSKGDTFLISVAGFGGTMGSFRLALSEEATVESAAAPFLEPPTWTPQNRVMVRAHTKPGADLKIEASQDLHQWSTVLQTNSVSGLVELLETPLGPLGRRFYRATLGEDQGWVEVQTFIGDLDWPAEEGVELWLGGQPSGVTGTGGTKVLQAAAGTATVSAFVPGIGGGSAEVVISPGVTNVVQVILTSEGIEEHAQMSWTGVPNSIFSAEIGEVVLEITAADGAPIPLVSLENVDATSADGGRVIPAKAAFELTPEGKVRLKSYSLFRDLIGLLRPGRLLLELSGLDRSGRLQRASKTFWHGRNTLSGQLVPPFSRPGLSVAGAPVSARLLGSDLVVKALADAEGEFVLTGVPDGTWEIETQIYDAGETYIGFGTVGVEGDEAVKVQLANFAEGELPGFEILDEAGLILAQWTSPEREQRLALHAARASTAEEELDRQSESAEVTAQGQPIISASVAVSSGPQGVAVKRSVSLKVPAGVSKLFLKYNVESDEYPEYVLQNSIYNDVWSVTVRDQSGASLFSIKQNVNAQRFSHPVWQSNGRTGTIVEEINLPGATTSPRTIRLFVDSVNVSDDLLETTVEAKLEAAPEFTIQKATRDAYTAARNDGTYFSIPQSSEQNTFHRYFTLKLSGRPEGSTVKTVRAKLLRNGNQGELMTLVDGPLGTLVQQVDAQTLRVRVTHGPQNPSTIHTQPPPVHFIRYRFEVELNANGETVTAEKDSAAMNALWHMPQIFHAERVGGVDLGGDDWCAQGTYEWMLSNQSLLTTIGDISGEHGRNIGHSTHAMGTDIDMYHFTHLYAGKKNGTQNYLRLRSLTLFALNGDAAAQAAVADWISTARSRLASLTALSTVARVITPKGKGLVGPPGPSPLDPYALPAAWIESMMTTGSLTDKKGRTLNLGLPPWSNNKITFDYGHDDHYHVTLDRAAIRAD